MHLCQKTKPPISAFITGNSLTTKKADDKIFVCNFSKNVKKLKLYHIEKFKEERANSVDLDEVAH